jgi:hypothetical protein
MVYELSRSTARVMPVGRVRLVVFEELLRVPAHAIAR